MRAPCAVGSRPSPPTITPALTSSSLYLVIDSRSSVLGNSPASDTGLPGTRTMKRIAACSCGGCLYLPDEWVQRKSTASSAADFAGPDEAAVEIGRAAAFVFEADFDPGLEAAGFATRVHVAVLPALV